MTLRQLGARAKVPIARLSQIENGLRVPNLRQARTLAEALRIPVEVLLPPDVRYPFQITREGEIKHATGLEIPLASAASVGMRAHHSRFWPLAPLFVGRLVEPFFAQVMPLPEPDLQLYTHHHQEFAFVLKGTIEFLLQLPDRLVRETLTRGDSVYFKSDLPHCFRSLESSPATSLHIFSSSPAPLEMGIDWLSPHPAATLEDPKRREGEFVAGKVAQLRTERGWTVEELARVTRVKPSELHRIERGTRSIPLDVLVSLARTFGKPVRELLGPTGNTPPYSLVRSRELAGIRPHTRKTPTDIQGRSQSHAIYYPLADGFPDKLMFPYFVRIRNVEADTLTMHEHHGQEFIYVLDGELELSIEMGRQVTKQRLRPGDCCYIDSTVPHLTRGYSRNPFSRTGAEVIDLFACPLGETYLFERSPAEEHQGPDVTEEGG